MKKFFTRGLVLSLLLCVLALSFLLVSCNDGEVSDITTDRIAVIVTGENVELFYSDSSSEKLKGIYNGTYQEEFLGGLINRLGDENILSSKSTSGVYGAYFTEIGLLKPSLNGYLYFYTNLEAYEEAESEWSTSVTFEDKEYSGANVGAAALPLIDGAIYVILLVSGS